MNFPDNFLKFHPMSFHIKLTFNYKFVSQIHGLRKSSALIIEKMLNIIIAVDEILPCMVFLFGIRSANAKSKFLIFLWVVIKHNKIESDAVKKGSFILVPFGSQRFGCLEYLPSWINWGKPLEMVKLRSESLV